MRVAAMTEAEIKEYEGQAREAQRMAENSQNERDKAAWLRIAAEWLRMLRSHRRETPQMNESRVNSDGSSASN